MKGENQAEPKTYKLNVIQIQPVEHLYRSSDILTGLLEGIVNDG